VAGSTRILTTRGYKEIESLEDQQVSVWNGRQFSECTVRKTGTLQKLMRVHFSNGAEIACTPYHKFYISNDDGKTVEEVTAADLRLGQKLAPWDLPTMIPTTDIEREWTSAKLRWLEDVFDDNGYIEKNADGTKSLSFTPKILEKSYLDDLVQMLQTTGVHSTISNVAGCRRLEIDSIGLVHLIKLGFRPQHLDVSNPCGENPCLTSGGHSVRVTGMCEQDELQDTWCFSEPLRHMGMFNGVLTGNCSEIMEYTAPDEIAVCNLGSLSLPAYLVADKPGALPRDPYDFAALHAATKILARNLDRVIDVTFYPVPEASASNARHRPIGIGVQGLADVFFALGVPFDSETAAELNRQIFATIYHAAVETSAELAIELGAHPSHPGSPASRGQLQFDLWGVEPCIVPVGRRRDGTLMRSWNDLRALAASTGLRNSLLLAPMPTASTAQIMGNTEAFEPVTSNLYSRTTLAGTFTVVNTHLMRDLLALGLWTPSLKNQLVAAEGSVQSLDIPAPLKAVYKTAYELSMKTLIDMAADRGAYVDQSMSLNMFVAEPTFRKLSSMHFYAWRKGLKTGMYYLRSKAASGATKITVTDEPAACDACSG
jgi:ribonucleoside-diphosphate reductase alpha chain